MLQRVLARRGVSRCFVTANSVSFRVRWASQGCNPCLEGRESSTFKDAVFRNLWTRGYQRYNKNKWRHFARSATLLPAVLTMAAPIYHEETDMDESEATKIKDDEILELLNKGKRMLDTKCSVESVEKVYTEALHLALARKDKSTIAYVQDVLANFYLRHGQFKKAEELFRNVIRNLLDLGVKENHVSVIEISLKLATIYASGKDDELAITGYEWVIEKCRGNVENLQKTQNFDSDYKNQIALLGMALDSYGRYLYMSGKYTRSLEVTKEACEISKELFGESDVRTLVIYNDIGAILNTMGELDEAERIVERALLVASKSKDVDHGDVAVFWVNLSSIHKKHKKLKEMAQAFENARKEAKLARDHSLQRQVEQNIQHIEEM